jgi:hypothetical protein
MFTRVLDLQFSPAAVFKRLCKKIKNKYKSKTTISEDKKTVTVCGLDMQGRDQSVEVSLHSSRGIEFAISDGLVRDRLLPTEEKTRVVLKACGQKYKLRDEGSRIVGCVRNAWLTEKHEKMVFDIVVEAADGPNDP